MSDEFTPGDIENGPVDRGRDRTTDRKSKDNSRLADTAQGSGQLKRLSVPAHLRLVSEPPHAPTRQSEPVLARPQRPKTYTPRPPADSWEVLRHVAPGPRSPIAAGLSHGADDMVVRSFDHLRTRLLKTLRTNALSRVAVASPTRGCGTTFTAAHLALSLAQVPGDRVVLLDLNMRRPGLAQALDIRDAGNMRGFLRGSVPVQHHIVRSGKGLAVGLTQTADAEASHLLHSELCALIISDLMDQLSPDTLICDLPPILEHDDLSAFLPQVDGVLLVADGTQTLPEHIAECERRLEGQTRVLGVVLNQARLSGPLPSYA